MTIPEVVQVISQVRAARAWTAFLVVIAVGHHLGTLTAPLGEVGDIQWADVVDLLLPWAVVATAGTALLAVSTRCQIVGAAGLLAYVQGHGIHLAANSIAERQPSATAFFWDELAGHAIWYSGLYVVVGALLVGRAVRTPPGLLRLVLAVVVGATFATNALGGHAPAGCRGVFAARRAGGPAADRPRCGRARGGGGGADLLGGGGSSRGPVSRSDRDQPEHGARRSPPVREARRVPRVEPLGREQGGDRVPQRGGGRDPVDRRRPVDEA